MMSKHLAYDHECEGVLKVLTDVERNTLNVGCTIHDWRSRGEQDKMASFLPSAVCV